jgi:simple sugar transport system substrate-binding protein
MAVLEQQGMPAVWRRSIVEALDVIELLDARIAPLDLELGPLARADARVVLAAPEVLGERRLARRTGHRRQAVARKCRRRRIRLGPDAGLDTLRRSVARMRWATCLSQSLEEEPMSELDPVLAALERLDWAEGRQEQTPVSRWRAVTRRTALTGGAAGLAAAMLAACGSSKTGASKATAGAQGGAVGSVFSEGSKLKFVLVNHVTTNPFFVATKYGADDACKLLGCSYQWTGSENSNVSEMVNAMNTAITGGANGIGVSLVDRTAFNAPTDAALKAKIPVVAYNADESSNNRLAYIGQDLFLSGQEMGQRIIELVPSGDVALFIATPGSSNIQPRMDGVLDQLKTSGKGVTPHTVATGAAVPAELSVIDAYSQGHPNTKGYFAVDGGSTQSIAQTMQKYDLRSKGVKAGGYDLTPITQKLLAADQIDFTIDQQPYLQGFIPILQLFMYQVSGGLSGIADTNTGLKFLDKTTVGQYNTTKSRFEGTSTAAGVTKA